MAARKTHNATSPRKLAGSKQPYNALSVSELREARRRMDILIEKETGYKPDPAHAEAWLKFIDTTIKENIGLTK